MGIAAIGWVVNTPLCTLYTKVTFSHIVCVYKAQCNCFTKACLAGALTKVADLRSQ